MNDKSSEKFCETLSNRIDFAIKEIKNMNSFMSNDLNESNII